ncbi:MAG: DNA polymerase III subunit delta [Rhodobacteraceae bacterium]|nr:DNA polymerase III subunit delta [Paracoccaceae bacterium]
MKGAARDLARAGGRGGIPALLLHGADAVRVAARRDEVVAALLGPGPAAEMRLSRLSAGPLRADPAALAEAVQARGFFAGPRVVVLEDGGDAATPAVALALDGWQAGDATVVVTAGVLRAASSLRRLFEGHAAALAVAIRDDPPGREEVAAMLAALGAPPPDGQAAADLDLLARTLETVDLRHTLERLALYAFGAARIGPADVAACAPLVPEAALDAALDAAAEGRPGALGPLLARLAAQGVTPVALAVAAGRHFRLLHAAAADPAGPAPAIARARPPVFGPRRDRLVAQARGWGLARLEAALALILETDLALRSPSRAPAGAVIERCLIRLAMLARAGGPAPAHPGGA